MWAGTTITRDGSGSGYVNKSSQDGRRCLGWFSLYLRNARTHRYRVSQKLRNKSSSLIWSVFQTDSVTLGSSLLWATVSSQRPPRGWECRSHLLSALKLEQSTSFVLYERKIVCSSIPIFIPPITRLKRHTAIHYLYFFTFFHCSVLDNLVSSPNSSK